MLKPTALLLIATALLAFVLALLHAYTSGRPGSAAPMLPPLRLDAPPAAQTDGPTAAAGNETRRLAMQDAYADLEKDRLLLNRQLGSLNAKLWGLRLPAARARKIQEDMMGARKLLSSPPLLGAFHDVDGIRHERDRVHAALERLKTIEEELGAVTSG
jgi:hypothetical protein